jgi:hypothetical protein
MKSQIDGEAIRKVLLEVIKEYDSPKPQPGFQSGSIRHEVASRLGIKQDVEAQRALLISPQFSGPGVILLEDQGREGEPDEQEEVCAGTNRLDAA